MILSNRCVVRIKCIDIKCLERCLDYMNGLKKLMIVIIIIIATFVLILLMCHELL